jgi:diaminopimelate decarboxylase
MDNIDVYLNENLSNLLTPCYIYSKDKLHDQIKKLRENLPPEIKVLYSLKANPNSDILGHLKNLVDGFDVSTPGEAARVFDIVKSPRYLSYVGPAKTKEDIATVLGNFPHTHVVVESTEEFHEVSKLGRSLDLKINVMIRLQMSMAYLASGRKVKEHFSQFGITEDEVEREFRNYLDAPFVNLLGFHCHAGSNFLNHSLVISNLAIFLDFVEKLVVEFGFSPKTVNLGGGFGLAVFPGQAEFDLREFCRLLERDLSQRKKNEYLKQVNFIFELGRYISGPAGTFLTKVLRKKKVGQRSVAILDGGFPQNMGLVGFDQIIKKRQVFRVLVHRDDRPEELVTLVGPSCYSADVLAEDILLPRLEVGDHIFVSNSGAYGKSFSPTEFLSCKKPGEFLI